MKHRASVRGWLVLAVVWLGGAWSVQAETRLSPSEQRDLLEPWSMEFVPGATAPATPRAVATMPALPDTATAARAGGPVAVAPPQSPLVPDDSDPAAIARAQAAKEQVLVVRCRQLLIGQPAAAERLGELLRGGASFEAARRAVGSIDLTERTRDYALDELQPDLQREVEELPEGGWSRTRPWNGRTALFQVVTKTTRERGTIPQLGAGLSPDEQSRLARTQRDRSASGGMGAANAAGAETRDLDPAAVVQQVQPTPPEQATTAGTVVVVVQIGRTDDVTDVQVESSSGDIFIAPALDAARRSTYRSASRNGIPELGSVRITFNFPAPQAD